MVFLPLASGPKFNINVADFGTVPSSAPFVGMTPLWQSPGHLSPNLSFAEKDAHAPLLAALEAVGEVF